MNRRAHPKWSTPGRLTVALLIGSVLSWGCAVQFPTPRMPSPPMPMPRMPSSGSGTPSPSLPSPSPPSPSLPSPSLPSPSLPSPSLPSPSLPSPSLPSPSLPSPSLPSPSRPSSSSGESGSQDSRQQSRSSGEAADSSSERRDNQRRGDRNEQAGKPGEQTRRGEQAGTESANTGSPSDPASQQTADRGDVERGQEGDASESGDPSRAADVADAQPGGEPSGEDGWEVSTELPEVAGDGSGRTAPEEGSEEQADGEGEQLADESAPGMDNRTEAGEEEPAGMDGSGDDLERALKDLDGEILDERMAQVRVGRGPADDPSAGQGGQTGRGQTQAGGGAMPSRRGVSAAVPSVPKPPLPQARDAPDARDDCVVARQLREAAMNERDPELREALWKEYERYKSC